MGFFAVHVMLCMRMRGWDELDVLCMQAPLANRLRGVVVVVVVQSPLDVGVVVVRYVSDKSTNVTTAKDQVLEM